MRKKLYFLIVICSVVQICYSYSFASNPNRTYYVKYILDSEGYAVKDESVMRVTKDRIYVVRNGKDMYWNCTYKGIEYEPQALKKGKKVGFHFYYLTTHKVYIGISDYKIHKHNDTFYYLINIDGQRQLAL